MAAPDKNKVFPIPFYNKVCFLKNIIKNPNIEIGDYTYYDDFDDVANFEKNVRYHYDFKGDKLKIGKFCMIASGASFIMNAAHHQTKSISAYPFDIFGDDWRHAMANKSYPYKGDTIIGNDVWIGHKATIMAGVKIGDGSIIAANAMVVKDVEPYTIVGGNPAQVIKKRFDDETIKKLLEIEWWHWDIEKITANVQNLTGGDVNAIL
ncbi:MAG: CatB-related O-acetyltransferase [Saprospiraceae bacterium]|nr:CatB-related O-acetyltransferase [Bacteroidia bacterium]NNE13559.1 CatB-related O-acetyltransferase [Saprospiraceae bacterium]NNL93065.1 CatB-related O-acetyltransferase [Saprospiraceae bacterium]